jgi:hypothetical protein
MGENSPNLVTLVSGKNSKHFTKKIDGIWGFLEEKKKNEARSLKFEKKKKFFAANVEIYFYK